MNADITEVSKLIVELKNTIAVGHKNALTLRERVNTDLAMHKAMRLVEDETARNRRRFELEEFVEAVIAANAIVRGQVAICMEEFKVVMEKIRVIERISGADMSDLIADMELGQREIRRVGEELEYVEQAVAESNSKIAQMV